jgi:hypothetical protein
MLDLTGHMMLRNEAFWVGYVVTAAARVLDRLIIIDCGSEDGTPDIVRAVQKSFPDKIHFETTGPLTEEQNGAIRQYMTDLTKTTWAAIIDGDEVYSAQALQNLLNTELEDHIRLTYSLMKVVDFVEGRFVTREQHNRQFLFHVPSTRWRGDFPFDRPHWADDGDPSFRHYHLDVQGWDLAHLPRSPLDAETRHRHRNDGIRQLTPITGAAPEFLALIREIEEEMILPTNPVLDQLYAAQIAY